MNERSKLREARHFLERMYVERGNLPSFTRELSAFMAAARSVLQYARAEAKPKPSSRKWYDQAMVDPVLSFFKDKRDTNIHEKPVDPVRKMTTEAADLLKTGDDDDEMFVPCPHTRTVEHYEFHDRPGDDVIDLSRRYLHLLDALIDEGVAKGFISV